MPSPFLAGFPGGLMQAQQLAQQQALRDLQLQQAQQEQQSLGAIGQTLRQNPQLSLGGLPQQPTGFQQGVGQDIASSLSGGLPQGSGSGGFSPQSGMNPGMFGAGSLSPPGSVPLPKLTDEIYNLETSRGQNVSTSPAGALGPMQVMPDTARQYGATPQDAADPVRGKQLGDRIVGDLYTKYQGNPDLTAIAYNAGPGRADKIAGGAPLASLPGETQNYLAKMHRDLDLNIGQGGVKLIQRGVPVPAAQESTQTAKAAGRMIDPQMWGRSQLPAIFAAVDKANPSAPDAVKVLAAMQLNKIAAPEERMAMQMWAKENAQQIQLGLKELQLQGGQQRLAESERHNLAMEGIAGGKGQGWQIIDTPEGPKRVNPNSGEVGGFSSPLPAGATKLGTTKPTAKGGAILPDDVAEMLADQGMQGDKSWKQNLGRGVQGPENIVKVETIINRKLKERGETGADLSVRQAEYGGLQAGERVLSGRTANIGMRINEAQRFAPLALQASNNLDRTEYPTLNSLEEAYLKGTGDKDVVRLMVYSQSFMNAYAAAVTPTGQPTEGAQARARHNLDIAWSQGQYGAAIEAMLVEMDAASKSPGTVREEFRKGAAAPAKGGDATTGPTGGGMPGGGQHPNVTKEQYNALPSGSVYTTPGDPTPRKKP